MEPIAKLNALLDTPDVPELGPGPRKNVRLQSSLREQLDPILSKLNLPKRASDLIRGAIFLWHDHLEAAHEIAQDIEDSDGSYLHAIMHRREPDYSNSKYWFRRVGKYPSFEPLAREAELLIKDHKTLNAPIRGGEWDPFAFVDACARVAAKNNSDPDVKTLRAVQAIELKLFLNCLSRPAAE